MHKITLLIFSLLISVIANAQVFTPIVGDYQCGQFPNGKQFLVKTNPNGFILVNSKVVKASLKKERKILRQRLTTINTLLSGFKKSRVSISKLLKGANSILKKIFGEDAIPSELPPGQAEIQVERLRQRLVEKDANLATIGRLINNCENGINPKRGKGTPISISIKPVSIESDRSIYGGFLIYSSKLKNKFSRKPTGYNVCLKLIFPDGSISRLYTGFGDSDVCGTGTFKFEGVAPSRCDQLLPRGQAGYVIPKREYTFTSLPDATTADLLDRMRLEVQQDEPIVGVMAFDVELSRASAVKACEAF